MGLTRYFSMTALLRLFEDAALSVVDYERVPVHGGSIRLYGARRQNHPSHSREVLSLAAREKEAGLTSVARYLEFARDVEVNRTVLRECLQTLRADGHAIAAYGAPAKGNTLLNYCGIDTRLVQFTVDQNPMKVGRYTPGTHIPVMPVATLVAEQPAYTLLLAWNFADEILAQQTEYRQRGGQFIIPIPTPRIV